MRFLSIPICSLFVVLWAGCSKEEAPKATETVVVGPKNVYRKSQNSISLDEFTIRPAVTSVNGPTQGFVVVLGDVHGDLDSFIKSLYLGYYQATGGAPPVALNAFSALLKAGTNKIQPPTPEVVLVQVGDLVNVGPDSVECIQLLDKVEQVLGWRTLRLFGNHELYGFSNFATREGKWGLVHKNELTSHFANSRHVRHKAFYLGGNLWKNYALKSQIAFKMNIGGRKVLFVHAGVNLTWLNQHAAGLQGDALIEKLNQLGSDYFHRDKGFAIMNDPESPLFTRYLANAGPPGPSNNCAQIPALRSRLGVDQIVIGHSPKSKILESCNGQIILVDHYMSRYIGWAGQDSANGNPMALVYSVNGGALASLETLGSKFVDGNPPLVKRFQ